MQEDLKAAIESCKQCKISSHTFQLLVSKTFPSEKYVTVTVASVKTELVTLI